MREGKDEEERERERGPQRSTVESLLGGLGLSLSNIVGSTLILTHMRREFITGKQMYSNINKMNS